MSNVTILFPDDTHPAFTHFRAWCDKNGHVLARDESDLTRGEYLFLVSCTKLIHTEDYTHVMVIHESDLPEGRGWSPLAWQILEGKNEIPIRLIKAADKVDCGEIFMEDTVYFDGSELHDEIHRRIANSKIMMIEKFISSPTVGQEQTGEPTYYRRRNPSDSEIDPSKPLIDCFNLLRIADKRFPVFFRHLGRKYVITIRRADE